MLNHGANLRAVQMLLGHSALSATQVYTHVASKDLTELHERHHPRGVIYGKTCLERPLR